MKRFSHFEFREQFFLMTIFVLSIFMVLVSVVGINSKRETISKAKNNFDDNRIVLKYRFDKPRILPSELGEGYYQVIMPDAPNYSLEGEPNLPSKVVNVLVPKNKEIDSFKVIKGNRIVIGNYLIEPGQKPIPLLSPDELAAMSIDTSVTLPKAEIYQSNNVFPAETLDTDFNLQKANGYEIAIFNLAPVEYLPSSQEVAYYDQLTVEIYLKDNLLKSNANFRGLAEDKERVKRLVDNPDKLESYSDEFSTQSARMVSDTLRTITQDYGLLSSYEFVLITRSDLLAGENEGFRKLINYKNNHGTTAFIATVDGDNGIYANYQGRDEAEKIRNFIRDAYQNLGVRYVMLGGDADGEDLGRESEPVIIPTRLLKSDVWQEDNQFVAGDIYYSCLDGSYDSNNNNIFGEKKDGADFHSNKAVDIFAEVYVGRVPVDSLIEVNNFVNKNISYLESYDEYLRKVLFIGEHLGFGGAADYASLMLEEIRNGSNDHGYSTRGFVENPFYISDTLYESESYSYDNQELIDKINAGIHIMHHDGHGWNYSDINIEKEDVQDLENENVFFLYTYACYSGSFDNWIYSGSKPSKYIEIDAIAEHYLTAQNGGFAFVGNTRFGWSWSNSTDGGSQRLGRWFWDGMFREDIKKLGELHSYSKEKLVGKYGDDYYRYIIFHNTLLGDPQLELFTYMPEPVTCQIKNLECFCSHSTIKNAWSFLNWQIEGGVTNDNRITVLKNNEVYNEFYWGAMAKRIISPDNCAIYTVFCENREGQILSSEEVYCNCGGRCR